MLCVQELKAQVDDLIPEMQAPEGYQSWFNAAQKKGYSGVGIYSRTRPVAIHHGTGCPEFDAEGRMVALEFEHTVVASIYFPSGSSADARQEAKYRFLAHFESLLDGFQAHRKQIVLCGDWNIAHQEIDLKNWKGNLKNSGFLPEERSWMSTLLGTRGWVDVYRRLYPAETDNAYTWWSNRGQAYAKT